MKTRCLALFSESALILALSFAAITAVQAQVGKGLIDPNVAAEKDLLALPSMTPAIVNFVLDVFFGDAFLTFPNKAATLGFTLPAFSSELGRFFLYIPIEEFLFYTLGFTVILSAYIWCDEYWLREYNVPDYELPADGTGTRGLPTSIVQIELAAPLAISAALVGAAFVYKRFGPHGHHDGFPSSFTFLVLASLLPSLLFIDRHSGS